MYSSSGIPVLLQKSDRCSWYMSKASMRKDNNSTQRSVSPSTLCFTALVERGPWEYMRTYSEHHLRSYDCTLVEHETRLKSLRQSRHREPQCNK